MKIIENDYRIELSKTWHGCPECWRNFVISLELPDDDTDWQRRRSVNYGLVEYNARREDGICAVFFTTLADKTWFIIRWS
jgi:hypothetical protein